MLTRKQAGRTSKSKQESSMPDYWVLALSKGNTRLFKLTDGRLAEVTDANFPLHYIEQFQHEPRTGVIVQYYDDESKVNETRLHGYFRHIGHKLEPYLKTETFPVILMTANTNAADFKRVTHLEDRIARCISGNYDHHLVSELQKLLEEKLGFLGKRMNRPR